MPVHTPPAHTHTPTPFPDWFFQLVCVRVGGMGAGACYMWLMTTGIGGRAQWAGFLLREDQYGKSGL